MYYGIVTATTVGYGDYGPNMNDLASTGALFATIIYIAIGVVLVGGIILYETSIVIMAVQNRIMNCIDDNPHDDTPAHKTKFALSVAMVVLIPVLASFVYWTFEDDWSYIDALYWSFVTASTVGYGDLSSSNDKTTIFAIFYIIISVSMLAAGLSNIMSIKEDIKKAKIKEEAAKHPLTLDNILEMDDSADGKIDPGEFLKFRLFSTGVLESKDEKIVDAILQLFDNMDKDHSGALDLDDLQVMIEKQNQIGKMKTVQFGGASVAARMSTMPRGVPGTSQRQSHEPLVEVEMADIYSAPPTTDQSALPEDDRARADTFNPMIKECRDAPRVGSA